MLHSPKNLIKERFLILEAILIEMNKTQCRTFWYTMTVHWSLFDGNFFQFGSWVLAVSLGVCYTAWEMVMSVMLPQKLLVFSYYSGGVDTKLCSNYATGDPRRGHRHVLCVVMWGCQRMMVVFGPSCGGSTQAIFTNVFVLPVRGMPLPSDL